MSENKETAIAPAGGGKVVFADDVIATIAFLAASEIEGVEGMSGTAIEGLTEKLGRKSYTKGIKVEVGNEECAVDLAVIVKYGFRIQDVCKKVQEAIKSAIETMTGLKVVEVNITVQSVVLEKEKKVVVEEKAPPVEPTGRVK
ncbi:MAG: Asp23/Gls24 family envelope stress response protein [Clostridiales bacterium]|nr:Asp23/Gls24 family envelope stress response protein [Clostridiales bacterium]